MTAPALRRNAALFLLLYTGLVLYLSLYPWQFSRFSNPAAIHWQPFYSGQMWLDSALNVCFYVPIGAAAFFVFGADWAGLGLAVLFGIAISLGVEWAQRYVPVRISTYDDVIANGLGGAVGAVAALAWSRVRRARGERSLANAIDPAAGVLAALWLLWHSSFALPLLAHSPFPREDPRSVVFWTESVNAFLGFLAVSLALSPKRLWMAWILALLPVSVLIASLPLLAVRCCAAILAILASRLVSGSTRINLCRFAFLIWLASEEFRPFRLGAPQPFSWIPFAALFSIRPDSYYPVVFGKLFFYSGGVWSMRYAGSSWRLAVGVPLAILAAGEFSQRYLQGRTPESTDLVLLASGALFLWMAGSNSSAYNQLK